MGTIKQNVLRALRRAVLVVLLGGVTLVIAATAQTKSSPIKSKADFDTAGVRAAVAQRTTGRLKRDAVLSAAPFADDAVWMNAFGRRVSGRGAIEQFFKALYANTGYQAGTNVEEGEPELTFLRPDVAVVHTFHRTQGQRARDGSLMSERRTHSTMVLTREPKGWRVRQEVVMDEKESTPRQ